jgi:N utilization substance protein B
VTGSRRVSRHRAVQILYQCDIRAISADEAIRSYYGGLYSEEQETPPEQDQFMEELVRGTVDRREEIDKLVGRHSEHWRMERMAVVERNVLRLAVFELLKEELPAPIVIDQAMELARKFSGESSLPFINGVLDAVHRERQRNVQDL